MSNDQDYKLDKFDKRELGADPKFAVEVPVPDSLKEVLDTARVSRNLKVKVEDSLKDDLLNSTDEVK